MNSGRGAVAAHCFTVSLRFRKPERLARIKAHPLKQQQARTPSALTVLMNGAPPVAKVAELALCATMTDDPANTLTVLAARTGDVPVHDSHRPKKELRFPAAHLVIAREESADSSSLDAMPTLEIAGSGGVMTTIARVTLPRAAGDLRTGLDDGDMALHAPKEPSARRRLDPRHERSVLAE